MADWHPFGVTRVPVELPAAPRPGALPVGFRVVLDRRTRFWAGGSLMAGGAPWRIAKVDPRARGFVDLLRDVGARGATAATALDRTVARLLLDRGFAHPGPASPLAAHRPDGVSVVVPAYNRIPALRSCLAGLAAAGQSRSVDDRPAVDVLVVDDFSAAGDDLAAAAEAANARVFRQPSNRGPAAARNAGLARTSGELVAFVDSDCIVPGDWLDRLLPHFADPLVAMVAPRVVPDVSGGRLLARHEAARSSLDMGSEPAQVRPGARLSFVPSAAIVVRRQALGDSGFDESLRLGEDVDLVWRLVEAGWQVRFDPSVVVRHESRIDPIEWVTRRFEYGTSAADLSQRHPGQLAPVRGSAWNLAALGLLAFGRPRSAGLVAAMASILLARRLRVGTADATLAPVTVATGIVADAAAVGHALRREWWPIGALAVAFSSRSALARAATAAMIAPVAWEWLRKRPDVDPLRYGALRLIEDAAYGSGVIESAIRRRTWAPLTPSIRWPRFGRSS
jgi:mycofactocin system glycosyltransferase